MPKVFGYTVTEEAAEATEEVAATTSTPLEATSTAKKRGLSWPFRRGADGNPVTCAGDQLRETRIAFVLGKRCSSSKVPGETPGLMRIGSLYQQLLQASFNGSREGLAFVYASRALAIAMPQEIIIGARVESVADANEVNVELMTRDRRATDKSRGLRVPLVIVRR